MADCSIKRRTSLTVAKKLDIIADINCGTKQADVARKFGLSRKTISGIWAKREQISKEAPTGASRSKLRKSSHPALEEALLLWIQDARSKNIPLSGPLIQGKARHLAFALDIQFDASQGWFDRFKRRHGLSYKAVCGESNAADGNAVRQWKSETLPALLRGWDERDIFNLDESGIFFKMLPGKTFAFAKQDCSGGKKSKDRLTAMFCTNMDGTEKERILVIGKSKNPRCLKNCSIGVEYSANKSAWMTADIFNKWLSSFDEKMARKNRKILLFLDSCSAHMKTPPLKAVQLSFFPPGCTSLLQPLDQGVIQAVKAKYRGRLVERLLFDMQQKRETTVNVRTAIEMLTGSWSNIKSSTVRGCFRKAGFILQQEDGDEDTPDEDDFGYDEPEHWPLIQSEFEECGTFQGFVEADDNLPVAEDLSDENIVRMVCERDEEDSATEESDSEGDCAPPPTSGEVMSLLQQVRQHIQLWPSGHEALDLVTQLEEAVVKNSVNAAFKQTKIGDYFSSGSGKT